MEAGGGGPFLYLGEVFLCICRSLHALSLIILVPTLNYSFSLNPVPFSFHTIFKNSGVLDAEGGGAEIKRLCDVISYY